MTATDRSMAGSSTDRIWQALRPSPPVNTETAEPDEPNEMRRLMLRSQEFRAIVPSADVKSADKGRKAFDSGIIDTVSACLAICADEERRAMSFGSNDGATAMRRSMHAIKKKFGIS